MGAKLKIVRKRTEVPEDIGPDPDGHDNTRQEDHVELDHPAKRFFADIDIRETKQSTPVQDADKNVIDYRDVTFKGYLSTFQNVTASDRDGDYVEEGAFTETLQRFTRNPIMLRDHRNTTDNIAGSFTKMKEDNRGLYVEASLSNAPNNIDARFNVAEGHLRTLSMGGIFHYREDGRGIFKVDLWEGSLTPIPANPDALLSTRSLTEDEKRMVKQQTRAKPPEVAGAAK